MRNAKTAVCAAVLCAAGVAVAEVDDHIALGKPIGGTPITHKGYVLGYKSKLKAPLWVAYRLTPDAFSKEPGLKKDTPLETESYLETSGLIQAVPSDLMSGGYLLLCAPANIAGKGQAAEKEAFSVGNAVALKQGGEVLKKTWETMNEAIREWATQYKEIWVVAGGIFPENPEKTAKGRISIPDAVFAVVARKENGVVKAIAFKMPQASVGKLDKYIVPVEQIEKESGVRLLYNIPGDQQQQVKSKASEMWPFSGGAGGGNVTAGGGAGGGNETAGGGAGDGGAKGGGGGATPPSSGMVWVLPREGVYYRPPSRICGTEGGTWMEEDAAKSMGFKGAN